MLFSSWECLVNNLPCTLMMRSKFARLLEIEVGRPDDRMIGVVEIATDTQSNWLKISKCNVG